MSQDFISAVRSAGMSPPAAIEPEKFYRFPGIGKSNGNTAGWCKLFADGTGGIYGDWASDFSESWRAERDPQLTPAERETFRRHIEEAKAQAASERKATHAQAAEKATVVWNAAEPASDDHPYLVRKRIKSHGLRVYRGPLVIHEMLCDGCLIVPMRDAEGTIQTLGFIHPEERNGDNKRFLYGGRKAGCYFAIGDAKGVLCIAEGYATAASIHQATGHALAVAFDGGNLEPVALALRTQFPDVRLIVCADNDIHEDGKPNTGIIEATKAAQAVKALIAVPALEGRKCDFNDMHQECGAEAVQRAIANAKPVETGEAQSGAETAKASADEVTLDAITRLAKLQAIEYELKRESEAERLGVRVSVLDKAVAKARTASKDMAQGQAAAFPEVEPWPEPVNAALLLDELAATFRRYVVLPEHAALVLALWVTFTWLINRAKVAPMLGLTSPEKRCGKTTLLSLLAKLSYRATPTASITPSATFRLIEAFSPTLLIDEADTFIRDNEELRGVLNAGHTRDTAFVWRTTGEDYEPRQFSTWGAKAIALIGKLPDTLADRSILVPMRRKLASERVEKLRHAPLETFESLRRMLARFAADNAHDFEQSRPDVPNELSDRAQDNWEPLLAIADMAGDEWQQKARAAALHLSGEVGNGGDSLSVALLNDIRQLFEDQGTDRLASADLTSALCELEERPWGEIYHGKGLTPHRLAKLLGEFGILPRSIRLESGKTPKGYLLESFQDAFDRYLPRGDTGLQSATPPQANRDAPFGEMSNRHTENLWRFEKPSNPATGAACGVVAFQKGGNGEDQDYEAF